MLAFGPISSTPVSALPEWAAFVLALSEISLPIVPQQIRAATYPFITRDGDVPANQPFEGRLELTLRIDTSIVGSDGYSGFAENISEFTLINSDGFYDDLAGALSINGQQIICSVGRLEGRDTVAPYAQFIPFAILTGERFRIDRTRVTIECRDPSLLLSTKTVQQRTYGGTGELDGVPEIAGQRYPFGDGVVFNATPTLIIGNELLYQFNDGAVTAVISVKDGGVPLTLWLDYGTVALLRIAAPLIPPGYYGTCIADGYLLLGGSGFKQITVDFYGLRFTTADIIKNVALTSAGLTLSQIDELSFDILNNVQSAFVGYYLGSDSNETCADMFTALMHGIGGWHGQTPTGTLYVRRFDAPTAIVPAGRYNTTGGNIIDIDITALPTGVDPPPHRRRVIYGRNFTVMTDLFGSVSEDTPDTAEYLKSPYKLASTTAADTESILIDYPDAPDPAPVESFFGFEVDATAEAVRLFGLYSFGFKAYRFTLKNALFGHSLGQVVEVTDSRLGLTGGKLVRLVDISEDLSKQATDMIGFG